MKNIMLLPKTLTRKIIIGLALFGLVATPVLSTRTALAAGTITVQPNNMQGWTTTNQDLGATVGIVDDSSAQFGQGSLQFHTGCDHDSKAQISKLGLNVPLSSVTEMSYWTKQNAGNTYNYEIPSYQLRLDMDGTGRYVTDFYYYPSANTTIAIPDNATVINSDSNYCVNNSDATNTVTNTSGLPSAPDILIGTWQKWNVLSGKWASYQPIPGTFDSIPELTPGEGGIDSGIAGAARGGGEFYTITDILRKYPSAKVVGIGSNLGVFYENSTSFADGISMNNTAYDFEINPPAPVSKSDCKKAGWLSFDFVNQGKCIVSLLKK